MKKTLLFLMILALSLNVFSGMASTYIAYTDEVPTIDGDIDAVWSIAPTFTPTVIMDAESPSDGLEGNGKTQIENPAGQWRALFDENNFYFLVEVNDANPVNNSFNGWNWAGDGVEIFLARENGTDQKQYGFGYKVGEPRLYGSAGEAAIEKVIKNVTGGYILEVKIPLHSIGLGGTSPSAIKMELGINQSNTGNGRSAQLLSWHNSRSHYNNSSNYTVVSLSCGEEVELESSIEGGGVFACAGEEVTLTATLLSSLTPGLDYTWYEKATPSSTWEAITTTQVGELVITATKDAFYKVTYDGRASCHLEIALHPEIDVYHYSVLNCTDYTSDINIMQVYGNSLDLLYQLNDGDFQEIGFFEGLTNGTYTITVMDEESECKVSFQENILIPEKEVLTLKVTPSNVICLDSEQEVKINVESNLVAVSPDDFYIWYRGELEYDEEGEDIGDGNEEIDAGNTPEFLVPSADLAEVGTYTYSVEKSGEGCPVTASIEIRVKECFELPTAITPYERGAGNDIFAQTRGTELYIFNRHGVSVYKEEVSNAADLQGWNGCYLGKTGAEVDPGVYFYVLVTEDETLKGTVEVIKTK